MTDKAETTWALMERLALELPGVEVSTSYGTPALKVKGRLMIRLREDEENIAVRTDQEEREVLLASEPEVFFLTDHYRNSPFVLARIDRIKRDDIRSVLEMAWESAAPASLKADTGSAGRGTD